MRKLYEYQKNIEFIVSLYECPFGSYLPSKSNYSEKCIALVCSKPDSGENATLSWWDFFYCGKKLKWQKIPLVNVKFQIYGKVFATHYLLSLTKSKRWTLWESFKMQFCFSNFLLAFFVISKFLVVEKSLYCGRNLI